MQPTEPMLTQAPYRPHYAEEARKLALMRATDEHLAEHFDIPLATLAEWLASIPDFAEGVRYGRKMGDADVVDAFHQNAVGFSCEAVKIFRPLAPGEEPLRVAYIQHRPPNTSAGVFWLVNRLPDQWKKVVIEAKSAADAKDLSTDELNRRIALLSARVLATSDHPRALPAMVPAAGPRAGDPSPADH